MRQYYDNFNEDYELGYKRGRRDALRELRESITQIKGYSSAATRYFLKNFSDIPGIRKVLDSADYICIKYTNSKNYPRFKTVKYFVDSYRSDNYIVNWSVQETKDGYECVEVYMHDVELTVDEEGELFCFVPIDMISK